jgi:hypothetical protein
MGFYLIDNPNPNGPHYYTTRRGRVLAIVVHITAGLEDLDATDDNSAEATAQYAATTDRKVSWHSGSDADTAFDLLPDSYTAWQCQGYNSTTYGHEINKRHTDWRDMPEPWCTRTLALAARHLAQKAAVLGVPLRHASKAELDRAIAGGGDPVGFVSHWQLDPDRRSDPGLVRDVDTFPWDEFFALMDPTTPIVPQEDDMPVQVIYVPGDPDRHHYMAVGRGFAYKFKGDTPEAHKLAVERYQVGLKLGMLARPEAVEVREYDVAEDLARRLAPPRV